MKPILVLPFLASSVVAPAIAQSTQKPSEAKPNLLIIMADQWRGRALGFLGSEPVQTPNLDKLAQSGVVFNQAVSGYPVSSPARGMLMSGAYPHVNGVLGNCNSWTTPSNVELKTDIVCWSDILNQQGYATGYIGKWHLDKIKEPFVDCANNKGEMAWNEWCEPERRHGFQYWLAYGTYDRHLRPLYWDTQALRDEFHYVDQWGPEYEADRAIDFINSRTNGSRPFALMVSMNPPHTGYELVPDRYKEIYKDIKIDSITSSWANAQGLKPEFDKFLRDNLANYYACMSGVDDQVGRILATLKKTGELDNTIVVFTSDHGDMMGVHNRIGKNIFYEESMRIPMIISYPDALQPRVDDQLLISLEDLYPTLITMMGFEDAIPATVQTKDLSKQVKGSKDNMPTSQIYIHWSEGDSTELITPKNGSRGLRTYRYTYSQRAVDGKIIEQYLFDRQNDPWELNNIISKCDKKLLKALQEELNERLVKAQDPWVDSVK